MIELHGLFGLMFLVCSCLYTKKTWTCSLLFSCQRKLTLSAVNWMMKRGSESSLITGTKKKLKKMETTDHTLQSGQGSQHASLDNIKEVKGDLFTCPETHSLAHCISADVKMGKGIAVMFKNQFGGVEELLKQNQRPGGLAVLNQGDRFIYYLVTKGKYWEKPTYKTLYSSLVKMRDHNKSNMVTHVCMPKIGCGLDRLEWNKVLPMIQEIYADLDIQITIYHYEDDKKGAGRGRGNSRFDGYNHRDHRSPQSYSESGTHDAYASNRRGLLERLSYHPGGSVRPPYHSGDNRERRCQWQTKNPSLKPKDGETLRKATNEGRAPINPQKQESTSRNRSGDQETSKNSDEKDQKPRDDIKQRSINEKHQKLNKKHEAYDKKENAVHNKSKEEQRECQEEMNVKESSHEYEEDTTNTGAAAQSETPPEFKHLDDVSQLAPAIESTKPTVQEHGRDCADDGGHTSGKKKKKKKKKKHKSKE